MRLFSKKAVKVGFLTEQSSIWTGGINYFRNLFIAVSMLENPKIIPYVVKTHEEQAEFLMNYAKPLDLKLKRNLKYQVIRFFTKIFKLNFNKEEYVLKTQGISIISHSNKVYGKLPLITWIPDFQHVFLPEMFDDEEIYIRGNSYDLLAKNSNIVILSSEDAKEDFQRFYPEYADKARVLHFVAILNSEIYEKTDAIKSEIIEKFKLPKRYFYVPNQFWKHKNHKVVLEAVSILKTEGIDVNLIFSGNTKDYRHPELFKQLKSYIAFNDLENNVKILGFIELIEVYYLMRNCISIINPSLFEGWSTTVEEAKSIGKNIILSNLPVHVEQNPCEAIYFNPKNAKQLAEILKEKWLSNKVGPDLELEQKAKEDLKVRILEFGQSYQKIIVNEVYKKK